MPEEEKPKRVTPNTLSVGDPHKPETTTDKFLSPSHNFVELHQNENGEFKKSPANTDREKEQLQPAKQRKSSGH